MPRTDQAAYSQITRLHVNRYWRQPVPLFEPYGRSVAGTRTRSARTSGNSCLAWGVFSGRLSPTGYMFARSHEDASCEGCRRLLQRA
ncbi:hypothetical protein [Actinacidiphila yeochonensis]|uniref:hypothetical protein n=1 Tax=Actinacidiphila yeochonensis TaxID=89050 RepID=UPI000560CF47|nr:hypothetical protein [Actinacidiphila yeochonensis]